MSYEMIALLMFSSMMLMLLTGQRVFGAIGGIAAIAALTLWGTGGGDIPFSAAMKLMKWYPLLTLPMFIFMGYILSETKIADDLYKMFHVWMGPLSGGLAIGTIFLMVLISAMNGLSVAGMAIGATIALPELLKRGYDKKMVSGVIQAGSSLGILVPPSVVLVLYAMIARAPVGQLWLAGIIPGLMMATMFVIYIAVRCKFQPHLGPALPAEERETYKDQKYRLLLSGLLPVVIFAAMMVPFINGWTSLVESSALGALTALLAALGKRRLTMPILVTCLKQTLGISCMFMWIILAALCFGAVFDGLGAVKAIESVFTQKLGLEPWTILILMQVSFLVMGTFLDDTAMLVIVAPLYVPLVGQLDLGLPQNEVLIWYGVLYTITTQIAYMTPPVWLQPLPDAGHGPEGNYHARHLRLDHTVRAGDDTCLGNYHVVSANCSLAARLRLRTLISQRKEPRHKKNNPGDRRLVIWFSGKKRQKAQGSADFITSKGEYLSMTNRRDFLKKAGVGTIAAAGASTLAAPAALGQAPIKWRLQTYAGPALAEHVIKPAIDAFNKAANGEMVIELYTADQLVPTGELFRAMQNGTIDAVQSDDDSMASPTEVTVFGGYFPFASRYSLDVPVLFNQYGLNEIWDEEYSKVGVKHISAGSWDPCHFATKDPIRSLADLKGKRVFTFPTAGRFMAQFGVVPVTLPWEDIEVAVQTGELDGIAWSGITEDYTVGWADVTNYFLTNNISGAWAGSFFANMERWNELPDHLKTLLQLAMDSSHYYRQWWYWGGEASLRVDGTKMELTTIPDDEWQTVEDAAVKFWDEIAAESETKAKVVEIFKKYNADMAKAGRPYRYG